MGDEKVTRRPSENDPKYSMQRNGMGQLSEQGRSQLVKDQKDYDDAQKKSTSNQSEIHRPGQASAPKKADNHEELNRALGTGASGGDSTKMPATIGKNPQTNKLEARDINTGRAAVKNDKTDKVEVVRADSLNEKPNKVINETPAPEKEEKPAANVTPEETNPKKEIGKQGGEKNKPEDDDFKKAVKHNWANWKGKGRDIGERLSRMAYGGSGGKYGHWAEQERGHEMTQEIMSSDQNFQERMKDKDFANAIAMVDKNFANDSYFRTFDRQTAMALQQQLAGLEAQQIPMLMNAIKDSGYSANQIAEQMRAQGGQGFLDTWLGRAGAATGAIGNFIKPDIHIGR